MNRMKPQMPEQDGEIHGTVTVWAEGFWLKLAGRKPRGKAKRRFMDGVTERHAVSCCERRWCRCRYLVLDLQPQQNDQLSLTLQSWCCFIDREFFYLMLEQCHFYLTTNWSEYFQATTTMKCENFWARERAAATWRARMLSAGGWTEAALFQVQAKSAADRKAMRAKVYV